MKNLFVLLQRQIVCALLVSLLLVSATLARTGDLTQAQAIARVRSILRSNAASCRLKTQSVSAIRVKAGWRVTARITMSSRTETAVWIVSQSNGAVAQNQLTAEIANGCP